MANKFEKYAKGKFEIKVDDMDLDLDVKMKDISKIMSSQKGGEVTEESAQKMIDSFLEILKRSYPEENAKAIESFLMRNFVQFTTAFVEELGWADKGDLNKSFLGETAKKQK